MPRSGDFTRKEALHEKFNIAAIVLLFAQWNDRQQLKEWLADLATRTLGDVMWWRRHRAVVLDGAETLDAKRSRSNAAGHLRNTFAYVINGGWLHDADMTSWYDFAAQLAMDGLFALPGGNVISDEGPARRGALEHWYSSVLRLSCHRSCSSSKRTGGACTRSTHRASLTCQS